MVFREGSQDPVPLGGNFELDAPPIIEILIAMDQSRVLTALAEFDHGVVPQPQPLCCIGHRCLYFIRSSGELQEQLVLLRVQAGLRGTAFAELEELTEFIAELC